MKWACLALAGILGLTACQSGEDRAIAELTQAEQAGEIAGAHSIRVADAEPTRLLRSSITPESRFRIASLTKVLTQVAILRLADQGELSLDQSLASLRPNLRAEWAETVTIRHLLNFSSGLPHELGDEDEGVRFDARGSALAFMDAQTESGPRFPPGSRTAYSNLGYLHLGAVIEAVTGQTYAEAIHTLVSQPVGLTETGFGRDDLGEDGHLHGWEGDPPVQVSGHPISQRYSSGGLHTSLRDMERLSAALQEEDFLSPAAQDEFFTQFGRPDARDPAYMMATGHVPGFTHAWLVSRDPEFTIISLNNAIAGNPRVIPDTVTRAGSAFLPSLAERRDRYQPTASDGWTAIRGFDDMPDHDLREGLTATLNAILSGSEQQARDALMRLHGLDPTTADEADLEDFSGFARGHIRITAAFGPFHPIAWRLDGERLQIYLESEDNQRGIHFAAQPSDHNPAVASTVSLGTYGFDP